MGLLPPLPRVTEARRGALGLLVCASVLAHGCGRSKPLELRPAAGCRAPEFVACLQPYSFDTVGPKEFRRIFEEALPRCLAHHDRKRLADEATCLPIDIGKTERGQPISLSYRCPYFYLAEGLAIARYAGTKADEPCPVPTAGTP
jgi:hypothetical protein